MEISSIGLTPLKGGRHQRRTAVDLTADGPVGDRLFCLVDPARERVLRTVENPALLASTATLDGDVLTVRLPGTTVTGTPVPTGEEVKADYWGRGAHLEVVDGPWAAAYADLLGRPVLLARVRAPGEVVYGAPVTLVGTGSLRLLAERLGAPVDPARVRATFVVDTGAAAPHLEDNWTGGVLDVGAARLRLLGPVPRCAVLDLEPGTGRRDLPVLATLAGYRRERGEVRLGVYASVLTAGRVHAGDPVALGKD